MPCEWSVCVCYWKSRDVIQAENLLLLLSWFDRAQKDDISILYIRYFSRFTYNSNLSVHLYLSKAKTYFFFSLWQHIVPSYFGDWVQAFALVPQMVNTASVLCAMERVWKRSWAC